MKGENLKGYLSRFNNAMVRVNDPNQKFFVKAFHKGLHVDQLSDSLALRRPSRRDKSPSAPKYYRRCTVPPGILAFHGQATRIQLGGMMRIPSGTWAHRRGL
ncbi:hypothetical protein CR513_05077, partial [Mucuna pruriens]